jgi:2-phosphosulfolactate phosphatase
MKVDSEFSTEATTQAGFNPWPDFPIHLEWGKTGAQLAATKQQIVVLVDVLSFSTSLSIACNRGATVLAYSLSELKELGGLKVAAKIMDAQASQPNAGRVSLSPTWMSTVQQGDRIIATSLNGASCAAICDPSPLVLLGCLRNSTATAKRIAAELSHTPKVRVTIVPCGERWSSLIDDKKVGDKEIGNRKDWRPGIEDWLGAGAIANALSVLGLTLSIEAKIAAEMFLNRANDLPEVLRSSISGRELIAKGFDNDVQLAAMVDADPHAVLRNKGRWREFNASAQT